jgi:hypothetical protein
MEIAIASSVIAACLVGLINWLFSQPGKSRESLHALEIRVTKAEERLHGVGNRVTKTEEAIEDIRENMVRRSDLESAFDQLKEWFDRR